MRAETSKAQTEWLAWEKIESDKPQRPAVSAGAACLLARGLARRGGIYQLILWLRRGDVGETSLARLLAASRVARPYPPDRVLNPAGNSAIGPNADFKCEPLRRVGNPAKRERWGGPLPG